MVIDTALTAADLGGGWNGVAADEVVCGTTELRLTALISGSESFAFGFRRFGPFARLFVMCVSC